MNTIEELLAKMRAITEGAENRAMTDDEMTQYERLEGELATARKDPCPPARLRDAGEVARRDAHAR